MTIDVNTPARLRKVQLWFGSIIGRPIDEDSRMNPLSPSGERIEVEACRFIKPSPTLRPAQRIEIYNQQYWWRLLSTLQESFPTLTRLFCFHDFNRLIGIPYLIKFPSHSWSLNNLGSHLPDWAEREYHGEDRPLIVDSAKLDWAYNHSFTSSQMPPISTENMENGDPATLLEKKLYLQPHIHLFKFDYDLVSFRAEFIKKEPEHWIEHDFPELKKEKEYHFIIFRNQKNDIAWRELSPGAYHLLYHFQSGSSIEEACEWLEKQNAKIYEDAMNNLHKWFQEWIVMKWLTLQNESIQ